MPVPIIAAGAATIAARLAAKKVAQEVAKKAAKSAAANARGLKAANKPLSKGNKKLVTQIKQQTGYIAMDRRPTPPTVAAALKKGPKGSFISEAKKIAMQEARSMSAPKKISPAQKMLNDKTAAIKETAKKSIVKNSTTKKVALNSKDKKIKSPTQKQINEHYRSLYKQWND